MKIINAMFSKVDGGLEQVFLHYTPLLKQQGNEVISVIHPKARIRDQCLKENVLTVHNFNQHDPVAIFKLRRLVSKTSPDCVITHSYRAAYLFKKTKTKVPKIAVCHVNTHYNFGTDGIIALTEAMRRDIIQSGIPKNRVVTVPNMIDIPDTCLFKLPIKRDIPVIGACARFSDIKGIDIFIEALALLKKKKIPFKALIAGDGPEKERYITLIHYHGLQDHIQLLGWITDKNAFYQALDIFCLPSREESFGLVILESMTHSLPMVLSALSGPKEIIGDSQSALLVEPANPSEMASGLERIITNQALADELAFNAFQRVQSYSYRSVGPLLQAGLETIIRS